MVTEFGQLAGMETGGISPDVCAQAIVRLFTRPRKRIVIPGWLALPLAILGAVENLLPGLLDRAFLLMYRHERQKQRNAATQPDHTILP